MASIPDMCVIAPPPTTEAARELGQLFKENDSPITVLKAGAEAKQLEVPKSLYEPLCQLLEAMASGKVVYMIPEDYLMTTQQAAEFLNVSRPYLVKLLDQNEIPCVKVGSHRRIHAQDVLEYKRKRDAERFKGLAELAVFHESEGFYE